MQLNDIIEGFIVRRITPVPAVRSTAVELEHLASGAQLLHLHNDDTENLFSITFPTPPSDDTGLPHILEHAVLAGSQRFPVREPFFEMVKMSMATFINAMTGYDATYYPVASNVKKDLFNLAEVYFDAVFHPLLTERTFQREGHHLTPADTDQPTGELTVTGIVYNEMKGAFSNPEARLHRLALRPLLPDTVYAHESGGDPRRIPDLTYDQLVAFHRRFYHPSNSRIFLYGDIPTREHLAFLAPRLAAFTRQDGYSSIVMQRRWDTPRTLTETYPADEGQPLTEKTYIALRWRVGQATQPREALLWGVLSLILVGNEAAPLKKAIIDSKLGQNLVMTGDADAGQELTFGVGIKGSEPDRAAALEQLTLETLRRIAEQGVPPELIDAAFQQAAYHHLEITAQFPLTNLWRVVAAWVYGRDPLTFLDAAGHLAKLREEARAPGFFEAVIRDGLLSNPHRLTTVLRPDPLWQQRSDEELAQRMRTVRATLSDEQVRQVAQNAAAVRAEAGQPNPPEALALLPQLKVSDLPRRCRVIPTQVQSIAGVDLLRNEVFSNGVNYLNLNFELRGLSHEQWLALPRFTDAVAKLGAGDWDFQQTARRKAANTGGIACWPSLCLHSGDAARGVWGLRWAMKALDDRLEPALDVLERLLFGVDPRDADRLRDVLVQSRASLRTALVHDGQNTATHHACRFMSAEGYLQHTLHNLPQLAALEELIERYDDHREGLMTEVESIRDTLPARGQCTVSFTGSEAGYRALCQRLASWAQRFGSSTPSTAAPGFNLSPESRREGLAGPMQVAYCVSVLPAPHASDPRSSALTVAARMLSMDYVLSEVRLKGNAYGAGFRYEPLAQRAMFTSYRDPNVKRTLDVYRGALAYVRAAAWTQADVDRSIIGTAKGEETPIRPAEATSLALSRHLLGLTTDLRQERYERLLGVTLKQVRVALEQVLGSDATERVCVVSSREKLEQANREMPGAELAISDILTPERSASASR